MKLLVLAGVTVALALPSFTAPPPTPKKPVEETIHGVKIVDNYRWLEDQDAPETRKWLHDQIAYTKSVLSQYPGRDALLKRAEATGDRRQHPRAVQPLLDHIPLFNRIVDQIEHQRSPRLDESNHQA